MSRTVCVITEKTVFPPRLRPPCCLLSLRPIVKQKIMQRTVSATAEIITICDFVSFFKVIIYLPRFRMEFLLCFQDSKLFL